MELHYFVESLEKLLPSEKLMKESGFDGLPDDIRKGYVLGQRQTELSHLSSNIIFELFKKFDPQYLRFADFTFNETIEIKHGLYIFAGSSYSELTFFDETSEVIEYDRDEWSILDRCAFNTDNFLAALIVLLEMYSLRFQNLVGVNDDEINKIFLERCVNAAGGGRYKRFYENIIF